MSSDAPPGLPEPDEGSRGAPGSHLGSAVRGALGWSFLNTFVGRVGASLVGIVLARILVPEDYGTYAVALVTLNALLSLNELGVSLAIVRWPGDVGRIAPTVITLAVGFSVVLYALCYASAPVVSQALGDPEAAGVIRLLCVGVLIDAMTAVPAGLMTREFMQRRRLIIDTTAFVVVATVSIGLAVNGAGAWSLAWGSLAGSIVTGVLILVWAPHRYRPGFNRDVARELLAFGLPLAGASLLVFAMLNVDYMVIGSVLGPVSLGLYLLAFNLSSWPVNMFSSPVRRVALPAFSRLVDDPPRVARAFTTAWILLLAATLPAVVMLVVFAQPLIGFIYGENWLPAAQALPFLALLAGVRILGELGYDFLVAQGRSRAAMWVQALWLATLVPALIAGAHLDGIRGVAVGQAAVALLVVVPAIIVVVRRGGVPTRELVAGSRRPLVGSVLAAIGALVALVAVQGRFLELLIGGCLVLVIFGAVVYPMRGLALRMSQATAGGQ